MHNRYSGGQLEEPFVETAQLEEATSQRSRAMCE